MEPARIRARNDLDAALAALAARDPRLAGALARVGEVPMRTAPADIAGLLRIVAGQQLSTFAAEAVWQRVVAALGNVSAESLADATDETLAAAGLSRQKIKTFRAVAAAVAGGLCIGTLCEEAPQTARERLMAIKGIGRWTADITLMFCAGHADILPVGDLAVRRSADVVLCTPEPLSPAELDAIGLAWSPHRTAAAWLLWAHYRLMRAKPAPATGRPPSLAPGMPL